MRARTFLSGLVALAIVLGSTSSAVATLPDPTFTQGSTSSSVTQANIDATICVSGYTATVRKVTTSTKSKVFSEYHIKASKRSLYVIDQLVPLEVGGSNGIFNLWPQKKDDAKKKDVIEDALHAAVCNHTVVLASAQRAFESDWETAETAASATTTTTATTAAPTTLPPTTQPPATAPPQTAPPQTAPPQTAPPATSPPATDPPATTPGGGATARCNDGTYSYAEHHQGACSSHGGVAEFYK